jgi:GR25 family glycosyltransferase involved in LPS biosynthesis
MSIRVKALTNWLSEDQSFDYFSRLGKYKGIELVRGAETPDYYFIINSTSSAFVPEKTILFYMEPNMKREMDTTFLQVRSHDIYLNNLEWHLGESAAKLYENSPILARENRLSTVISDKCFDEGHKKRIRFIRYLDEKNCIDIYGQCQSLRFKNYLGGLPYMNKNSALFPYKYHFIAENNREHNYITEKVVDCILSETLCFYWGAPNVLEYFLGAVVPLELEDLDADFEFIQRCISNNIYEARLPIIRKYKKVILDYFWIFPTLYNTLTSHSHRKEIVCINLKRRPDRRAQMVQKLKDVGITKYSFLDAVDGKTLEFTQPIYHLFRDNDFNYKKGTMGCALSHYNLWQHLVNTDAAQETDYYFILEDDVVFFKEFVPYFDAMVSKLYELDPTWDLFYPSYQMFDEHLQKYRKLYRNNDLMSSPPRIAPLNLDIYIGGFHCYLISKAGARKLCNFISRKGIQHGIDYIPKRYKIDMDLRLYECQYHLARADWVLYYNQGDSDIQICDETHFADWKVNLSLLKNVQISTSSSKSSTSVL